MNGKFTLIKVKILTEEAAAHIAAMRLYLKETICMTIMESLLTANRFGQFHN